MENQSKKAPVGRPRKYASNAERQAAYRARLKQRGLKVVSRVVRDGGGNTPLTSDIIDLSAVRRW